VQYALRRLFSSPLLRQTNKAAKKKEGIDTTTAKWERLMATAEEE
jgi:hypothetical protein